MNWNHWTRQIHRWLSIAFTITVIVNFIQIALGGGGPANWVTYSPLVPLALLLFTGLYLFLLPHRSRRRGARGTLDLAEEEMVDAGAFKALVKAAVIGNARGTEDR